MRYLDLFATLNRHRVQYVLIGGLAVALHGIERNTMDVDVAVVVTPDNMTQLVAAARDLALRPMLPVGLDALLDIETLGRWHRERNLQAFALQEQGTGGLSLDVLLFPPVDAGDLLSRAVRLKVADTEVPVACVEDLIALKSSVGRPIDIADIAHLQRLQTP